MKYNIEHFEVINVKELYGYLNEIHGGYIKANYHPEDDNIVILNYTEQTTFEKRWNKYTRTARGLILDLTDVTNYGIVYILARPFAKFPNYGEDLEYEQDIDWNEVETVMDKMDGSLGISYIFNGELRFATRGSFDSEQALRATEMWKRKYNEANVKYFKVHPSHKPTLLVEIIYPENRVVVDYKGEECLVLLGINYMSQDIPYSGLELVAKHLHLPLAKSYPFQKETLLHDLLKRKKEISANEEGWIVRFKNGKRLKIKGDEYLEVHRIMYGVSDKAKVGAWADGTIQAYIKRLPEEFRPEIENLSNKLDMVVSIVGESLTIIYNSIFFSVDNRKDYALKVIERVPDASYRGFLFTMYGNGIVPINDIKKYIHKNYKEYMEVIGWMSKLDSSC